MTLDIPTMFFVSIVTNVAMTLAVITVALRQSIPGLKQLAWGLVANSCYYLVLGSLGSIPREIAIGLGNTLGSLTLMMILLAVLSSLRRRIPRIFYASPVILMLATSLILIDDRGTRLIIASLILCYQIGLILWSLINPNMVGRGRMIMIITLIAGMSTMAYRALALALGWVEVSPFQTRDSLNTVFYMINYLGMFFLSFGFVLSTVEQSAEKNRRFAEEDPLTGLSNRRALFEAMDSLFVRAKSSGTPTTIMIIDIDHFKQVNDRYGHQAGDAVLLKVAETIQQRLRDSDIVGRIGGEEFLAVLPDTPTTGAKRLAEDLRETLASRPIIHDKQQIPVTISIGLHNSAPSPQALDADSMIASADEALYQAKANGRNRVEIAEIIAG